MKDFLQGVLIFMLIALGTTALIAIISLVAYLQERRRKR